MVSITIFLPMQPEIEIMIEMVKESVTVNILGIKVVIGKVLLGIELMALLGQKLQKLTLAVITAIHMHLVGLMVHILHM